MLCADDLLVSVPEMPVMSKADILGVFALGPRQHHAM
jgi:hypothetical protein